MVVRANGPDLRQARRRYRTFQTPACAGGRGFFKIAGASGVAAFYDDLNATGRPRAVGRGRFLPGAAPDWTPPNKDRQPFHRGLYAGMQPWRRL